MKERGMIFNAEMVRALLDGRKAQTRRPIKPQPELTAGSGFMWNGVLYGSGSDERETNRNFAHVACPFGKPGDRLWVRETDEVLQLTTALLASMDSAQDPVGFYRNGSDGYYFASPTEQRPGTIPLYTSPQPLTDAERAELLEYRKEIELLKEQVDWHESGSRQYRQQFEAAVAELQECRKAQPVPIVPGEMTRDPEADVFDPGFMNGWNACRDAMLQSEPVSNRDELPDGWVACSERMPDTASEKRVCVYTPTTHVDMRYRFVPASLFKAVCSSATHWYYMEPPAAPQKEVGS